MDQNADATLTFIGHIETPYETLADCPRNIQPDGPDCTLVLDPAYRDGLLGLVPGTRILVLYWFEGVKRDRMVQTRRGDPDGEPTGCFALRSPHRPNPIAAAVVAVERIEQGRITVRGLDCLNGTRLLDIKPVLK